MKYQELHAVKNNKINFKISSATNFLSTLRVKMNLITYSSRFDSDHSMHDGSLTRPKHFAIIMLTDNTLCTNNNLRLIQVYFSKKVYVMTIYQRHLTKLLLMILKTYAFVEK